MGGRKVDAGGTKADSDEESEETFDAPSHKGRKRVRYDGEKTLTGMLSPHHGYV